MQDNKIAEEEEEEEEGIDNLKVDKNGEMTQTDSYDNDESITTRGGLELGSYLFLGNGLQVVGLQSVPADRAGKLCICISRYIIISHFSLIILTIYNLVLSCVSILGTAYYCFSSSTICNIGGYIISCAASNMACMYNCLYRGHSNGCRW